MLVAAGVGGRRADRGCGAERLVRHPGPETRVGLQAGPETRVGLQAGPETRVGLQAGPGGHPAKPSDFKPSSS